MQEFIAQCEKSKEILHSAHLLQNIEINALIVGVPGVGKKALARYILPKAILYKAKDFQQDINNKLINLKQNCVIIEDIENISNIDLVVKWINTNNIRVIATSSKKKLNSKLANIFSINIEIPQLKKREKDIKALANKFSKEASEVLDVKQMEFSQLMINTSNNAHSLRKFIYLSYIFHSMAENEILMFMEKYILNNLSIKSSYKELLYLFEIPLLKSVQKKHKSQVQMAKHLKLNRITLRKKLEKYKDFLNA